MEKSGFEMVRYADDAVILCKSREEAFQAFQLLQEWVNNAKLTLHPEKTRILDASQPGGIRISWISLRGRQEKTTKEKSQEIQRFYP